jgi:RNA polymerase sigma factor (sigma-70 family)
VLQDVFVRAFGALRNDKREVNVKAWLYRVAHNRCVDHLRRPRPAASEIFEMSRKPLLDPVDEAQRRDDLKRLVADVGRLPEQQRSALLMREMDGLSYAELAGALDVTVPAVKSLLVRARVGLVEAQESRDADCAEIRRDMLASYDRGVKASGRARRHMRECAGCREYRGALRGMRRSFAALTPAGPAALLAKLVGFGGAGGGTAAAAGGGGGGAVIAGGAATACKVAAVVCATALTAGGAVEVRKLATEPSGKASKPAAERSGAGAAGAAATAATAAAAAVGAGASRAAMAAHTGTAPVVHGPAAPAKARRERAARETGPVSAVAPVTDAPADEVVVGTESPPVAVESKPQPGSGGTVAPDDSTAAPPETGSATGDGQEAVVPEDETVTPPPDDGTGSGTDDGAAAPVDSTAPPAAH